ncbi:MAG: TIGR03905 family TSCPD domain-containing protein [Clostridia bacterium]|nr:TIGR03905 family TSCPD domain-containing protein [Clostridia bacterium]
MFSYKTRGTCSQQILIATEGDTITNVQFIGGCTGNTQGVAKLVKGMKVDEVIARLKGIQCRGGTSCPDQLATALELMKAQQKD